MSRIAFPTGPFVRALTLLALPLLAAGQALAEPITRAQVTIIDLSAEANRNAPNDLARANAYFEAQDANPGELARRVNRTIAGGLETAKAYPAVKTRSGSTTTWPVYGKNARNIEGWRMRSEILLETRDTAALSELLGKLQSTLAIGQLTLLPAPETRKKAEDEATLDAIAAFQARAALIARAMGKSHRVRQMSVNTGGARPIYPMARAVAMSKMAEAEPAPIEAGDSLVTVTITGQIELPLD
ncbi:MAG: SIMPL domain-containing protein [Sterolibacteriaceae bacterium]|nr:SIMPL domain-containing protein [Sterolibacteriaceae bacterium]